MNKSLLSTFKSFLIIGSTSFGGYMALIAMARKKFVDEDKHVSDETLFEGITLSALLPGPVAVNVVAYIGYKMHGIWGAFVSILAVLMPSFLLVTTCAVIYYEYGTTLFFNSILIGIIPVVAAIILSVGYSMSKKNCVFSFQYIIAATSIFMLFIFSGYLAIVTIILVSGLLGILLKYKKSATIKTESKRISKALLGIISIFIMMVVFSRFYFDQNMLAQLFSEFSAVSLTLFGGGYVMIPILKSMLVDQLSWMSYEEFVFGISIGQITPGPILISAAFFGYKMKGILGALIATIAIFIPSSLLMIVASEFYQKIKENNMLKSALMGIKPAIIGLILFSGISILLKHMENNGLWIPLLICALATTFSIMYKLHPVALLTLGGTFGLVYNYLFLL